MTVIAPPALSDIPEFPALADRAAGTYNSKAYAHGTHMSDTFNAEVAAVAANVAANATDAAASAGAATTGAGTATTQAGISTTKSGEALTSAGAASASAATAVAQADIATTKASEAVVSAANANARAIDAAASAAAAAAVTGIPSVAGNALKVLRVNATETAIEWADAASVTLTGNLAPYVTQATTLTITNYDSATAYGVTATGGTASIVGDTITYTAGATAGSYALSITAGSALRSVMMTVQASAVATPTITSPASAATGIGQAPTITTSAFAWIGVSDAHAATDWELWTGPNRTGTLVWSSVNDTANKLSIAVAGGLLATSTAYYPAARHKGTTLGYGGWVSSSFTTATTFGGLIGTQGGQGFGVGVCVNGSVLVALGLAEMTGTTDKTHINYGNYLHSNGGTSCYVPKCYFRIGSASSARFATYGANAHDVVGIETFANEAAANTGGYMLHRAFINAGAEQPGFFCDKYLASKDGTTSCKSLASADPISLTTSATYHPSNGMTGCTGILADGVVLARSRGAGWNCTSIFMADCVSRLSLAHGQASTSATYCAWYDAAGTTNFPKGCNNNALADVNDASVTYTASTGQTAKPKTRANANFNKTTHNGQACGIADINGSMYQMLIGLTSAGSSATDTVAVGSGNVYALKTSADFAALTGGYGGATDAWGTGANLSSRYDLQTGLLPWGAGTAAEKFGNGANQVFSGATSGADYLRTCAGIGIPAGMSAGGSNLFGSDNNQQSNNGNLVPLAAGYWVVSASAGAFLRYWILYRSSDGFHVGFRACAYG